MHDGGNHNVEKSAEKSQGYVMEFHVCLYDYTVPWLYGLKLAETAHEEHLGSYLVIDQGQGHEVNMSLVLGDDLFHVIGASKPSNCKDLLADLMERQRC